MDPNLQLSAASARRVKPAGDATEDAIVKSAARAIRILEYFDLRREGARLGEVAEALDFPLSSTSELLRTLEAIGYLHFARFERLYTLTRRISLLGSWLDPSIVKKGKLLQLAQTLASRLGTTSTIALRKQFHVQYIHFATPEPGAGEASPPMPGLCRVLTGDASGRAILSTLKDAELMQVIHRANAEFGAGISDKRRYVDALRAESGQEIFSGSGSLEGRSAFAKLIDSSEGSLVIGVEYPEDLGDEMAATIRQTFSRELNSSAPLCRAEIPRDGHPWSIRD